MPLSYYLASLFIPVIIQHISSEITGPFGNPVLKTARERDGGLFGGKWWRAPSPSFSSGCTKGCLVGVSHFLAQEESSHPVLTLWLLGPLEKEKNESSSAQRRLLPS